MKHERASRCNENSRSGVVAGMPGENVPLSSGLSEGTVWKR